MRRTPSRIGPTNAGLTPLDSSNTLTNVYTVNCPRNANMFDADTAASAPRPAPAEPRDAGSCFTLGSSRRTRTNVRIDSTARTRERRPPASRGTQRRRQRHAENHTGRGATGGDRERTADICPRHQSRRVSDHQREEQRVRHPAYRPSDRDNGEYRRGGHQRVAQRVTQQGRQQQGLAGEPGGGEGQRHRERGDHHGIQADQQAGDRIGHRERRTDTR